MANIPNSCSNGVRGCQTSSGEQAMVAHEAECIYRVVQCPSKLCQSKIPFHYLLEHMEKGKCSLFNLQINPVTKKYNISWNFPDMSNRHYNIYFTPPTKFVVDKAVFFLHMEQYRDDQSIYFYIQMVGSKNEAKNYYYKLSFFGVDRYIASNFTGQAISIDDISDLATCRKNYFGMNQEMFKAKFMDKNGKVSVNLQIKNINGLDMPIIV